MRHFSTRRASSHKGPDFLSRLEALANFLGIKLTAFTVILFVCCGSVAPLDGRGQASCAHCVLTGIDVLERQHFRLLEQLSARHGGRLRVGLMTNQTGMDAAARRTVDVLFQDAVKQVPGLTVTTLFSPEHGMGGTLDTAHVNGGQHFGIADSRDPKTGLPIVSLFGDSDAKRHPQPEQMRSLDAVFIDLQDAGVRFYTYETVVGYFLEAGAKTGTEIVVLDRPNPINGITVQGTMSPNHQSYINYMALPVRHGMTIGELATYFNAENHLHARLTVVRMEKWHRQDWFDQTGLMWTNPSPNLRSLTAATLYPGVGLLEGTNISVGRGTEAPFERLGAPWISGGKLAAFLNARRIPGVRFLPESFTPSGGNRYDGELCEGIRMAVTDRMAFDSPELGVEIASALWKLYPREFTLHAIDPLKLDGSTLSAIEAGIDARRIAAGWKGGTASFAMRRSRYLLYERPP
jgi:uncharacterized protein YbbC (DUF1343 family)